MSYDSIATRFDAEVLLAKYEKTRPWTHGRSAISTAKRRLLEVWSLYLVAFDGRLKVGITTDMIARLHSLAKDAQARGSGVLLRAAEVGDFWQAHAYENAIVARCRPFTLARGPQRSEWFEDRPFVRELFHLVASEIDP